MTGSSSLRSSKSSSIQATGLPCFAFVAGSETKRAGTRTSASGYVKGETGKKAIAESLETNLAKMGRVGADDEKPSKGVKGGNKKEKTEQEKELAELKGTIKSILG